jgi:hypothetical protein
MKNLIILFFAVAFVFSCNTDKCADVVCAVGTCEEGICIDPCDSLDCGTGGTCTIGVCVCNDGYEKDTAGACNIEWSAKFLGANLTTSDTCYGDNGAISVLPYNVTISRTSEMAISTTNLGDFGTSNVVKMDVNSSTSITINDTDVAGRLFTGSGSLSNNVLNIDYVVTYSDNTKDTCMASITVQ